jgi:hypothetical protein
MKSFLLLVLLFLALAMGQESGLAQSSADLVGTWKLVSATDTTDKGQVIKDAYGMLSLKSFAGGNTAFCPYVRERSRHGSPPAQFLASRAARFAATQGSAQSYFHHRRPHLFGNTPRMVVRQGSPSKQGSMEIKSFLGA